MSILVVAHAASIALWLAVADPGADTESADAERPRESPGKLIEGRTIASVVDLDALTVRAEADVLPGEQPDTIDAVLDVAVDVSHRLDGSIRELELGVAVLAPADVEFAWSRLHTPPLRLTTAEVERKMPLPMAVITLQGDESSLASDGEQRLALRESYPDLELPPGGALAYLVAVGGYALEAPSERDVLRILDEGGPADLAALANWAMETTANDLLVFDDPARARIMAIVDAQIRRLRAPPAYGDFQRLNALTAVARVCVSGDDLERLLVLVRPMTILLAAAQVSYDGAAVEESELGISVHGFRRLQSRSDSALAWEGTLRHLRSSALDRLVRLAYEPDDFPDAPAPALLRSPLHVQASQLLLPLTTTEVARLLAVAGDRTQTQRNLLRFFVEVRHASVVEPLVEWLIEHPSHVDDVGVPALVAMGDRMLAVLVRRFDDREAGPIERGVVWRLLASLPERHAAELTQLSRAMGVDVDAHRSGAAPTLVEVLDALREHDEKVQAERIAELEQELGTPARDIPERRARVRSAELLAALSPARAEASADAIITAHVEAARAFDVEFPMERRAAIRRLDELPLGARHADAARAAILIEAELAAARGESAEALAAFERFDPSLEHTDVRAAYVDVLQQRWDLLLGAAAWDELEELLARPNLADTTVAEAFDVDAHRTELERHRRRPKIVLAVMIGAALLSTIVIGLHMLGVFAALRRRLRALVGRIGAPISPRPTSHEDDASNDDPSADAASSDPTRDRRDDDASASDMSDPESDASASGGPDRDPPGSDPADANAPNDAPHQAPVWTTDGGSPLDDIAA